MKLLFNLWSTLLLIGILFPSFTEENTGWTHLQSTNQTFYIFISPMSITDSLGNTIEGYGDGTNGQTSTESDCGLNPESCDVIGAFMSRDLDEQSCADAGGYYVNGQCDICVGWSYYNSYTENISNDIITISTTLSINGFMDGPGDNNFAHYCMNGEVPTLKFYDASEELVHSMIADIDMGSFQNNSIFLYMPDCTGITECEQVDFIATEDDPLSNDTQNPTPESFEITNVYPNPFNPSVSIHYSLGSLEYVNISIYDTIGRHITTVFDGFKGNGFHELIWTPEASVSSGNYIVTIETPNNLLTRKVTYLK